MMALVLTKVKALTFTPNPSNSGFVTIDFNEDLNEETAEVVIVDLEWEEAFTS